MDVPLDDDLDNLDLPPVKKGRAAKAAEAEAADDEADAGPETVQPETVTITPAATAVAPAPAKDFVGAFAVTSGHGLHHIVLVERNELHALGRTARDADFAHP